MAFAAALVALPGCAPGGLFATEQPEAIARDAAASPFRLADTEAPEEAFVAGGALTQQALRISAESWMGTRYRYGGTTRRGVDCSAYVRNVYDEAFGVPLPRTTSAQVGAGRSIRRADLQPGDLVFFRTGRGRRHVGIYLGDGQFTHASSSRGVVVDDLDSSYWRRTYWTSRRVLPEGSRRQFERIELEEGTPSRSRG